MSLKIISPGTVYLGSATGSNGSSSGVNLYDTKLISQAIADKGWAFQGYSTRQDLSKDFVPTVYTDIKTKYDNCDSAPSSDYTTLINAGIMMTGWFKLDDKYMYCTNTNWNANNVYLKRSLLSSFPAVNWEDTGIDCAGGLQSGASPLEIGDNLIILTRALRNPSQPQEIAIFNKATLTLIRKFTIKNNSKPNIYLITVKGIKTFFLCYQVEDSSYIFSKIEDNLSATETILLSNLTTYVGQPAYDEDNNVYWFWYANYICKTTNNFATYEQIQGHSTSPNNGIVSKIFKKGETLLITATERNGATRVSEDNGLTWNYLKMNNQNKSVGANPYFDGETMYGCIWDQGYDAHLYRSTDLKNFSVYMPNGLIGGNSRISFEPIKNTIFVENGDVKYLGIVKTIYTDNYVINGSSIDIDYYKYGSFKICVKDGGTNDANIDTVYNALGYENYFVIDDTSETVALPRNSNLWSFMYVGDNYISENIPDGNFTRLLPQASSITDMTSTSITFDSTNKVQPNTDYEYGELTTLTLDSSSIISSKLGTTIKFQSGTTATTIIDSSNIQWADGAKPEPNASKTCLIFIWDNTGFYKEW